MAIFKKIRSLKTMKGKELHITDSFRLLINDNENGTLCKVADINELSINIEKVLQWSIYKRKVLSKKSISNVNQKYLTKFMCKKTLNLYVKLIKSFHEKNINNFIFTTHSFKYN